MFVILLVTKATAETNSDGTPGSALGTNGKLLIVVGFIGGAYLGYVSSNSVPLAEQKMDELEIQGEMRDGVDRTKAIEIVKNRRELNCRMERAEARARNRYGNRYDYGSRSSFTVGNLSLGF